VQFYGFSADFFGSYIENQYSFSVALTAAASFFFAVGLKPTAKKKI